MIMKIFALSFLLACSIKMAKAESDTSFASILTAEDRTQVLQLIDASCVFQEIKSSEQILVDNKLNDQFFKDLDACLTLVVGE